MKFSRGAWRRYSVAIRTMILLTIVLGIAYPLVMTGFAQLAFPAQANGSTLSRNGSTIGSRLIGQSFSDAKGRPLAQWFQPRPSYAGTGYDSKASGASNLGPDNPALTRAIEKRKLLIERTYGVTAAQIPADALTGSGSGLDPDISPAYALLQIKVVAAARGLDQAAVRALVESRIQGRQLGYLGEPVVNVLELNAALAEMDK